jgi:hypothetical protein
VNSPVLSWLLDPASPGVRYLALRDLLDLPPENPELIAARSTAHTQGPIAAILTKMHPDGYWSKAGPGYGPKYYSSVWSLITLAQLGASLEVDERIARACTYSLEHALTSQGHFSYNRAPSGTIDCLQGNLTTALVQMGCKDPRLDQAFDWMARSETGEGIAPNSERHAALRYYAYKCGPRFACGVNNKLPCAWGAAKVMLAFASLPVTRRTPLIERAILEGVDFLFSVDPATAAYPTGTNSEPSGNWWKFGFPVFYVTDLLQIVEALVSLGYGNDPRLANALSIIRQKQDDEGRWAQEYDYNGKCWVNFGRKMQPNPWVTMRALRVLKQVEN